MRIKLKQRGVTLLELLAVVIVSILLLIGAFSLYSSSNNKNAEKETISAIGSIRLLIESQFPSGNYEELDNNALIASGNLPGNVVSGGGEIITAIGSPLFIRGNASGYEITILDLSTDNCVSIGNKRNLSSHIILVEPDNINPSPTEVVEYCSSAPIQSGGDREIKTVSFVYTNNINAFMQSNTPQVL